MEDKTLRMAVIGLAAFVIGPVVINGTFNIIAGTYTGIHNLVVSKKNKKMIKKGLKDGSIVEIDGKYYEVEVTEAE